MIPNKQYDLSELNKFFNEVGTPKQIASELVNLLFNYASCVDEDNLELFKADVGTIYVLYNELTKLEE
ncbi:hypothetical protein EAJ04_25155 [Bacteroides faecis]|jgi:hypothetical protein|nr:hypothetical protein EAJ04_25155 [Bacteroides faecis]DAK58059.1 MAG TPA: hypothetical protein [Caudoviricetes sp.]